MTDVQATRNDEEEAALEALRHLNIVSTASEASKQLFRESFRLFDVTKMVKLLLWLKTGREAKLRHADNVVDIDFIMTFCWFWHELIIAGLDTEALLEFALNWHLVASAKGHTKSVSSHYWRTVRALEELGFIETPVTKKLKKRR